jgi:ATP-dependent exoDNAse (exonuclease V) alpha subunit
MTNTNPIVLSEGQQTALDAVFSFLLNDIDSVFVLAGYSGTGKSTLVQTILDQLSKRVSTVKLINPSYKEREIVLTATTNKAAENLSFLSGQEVSTIHSFLNLRVSTDYATGATSVVPRTSETKDNYIIFIDEASYIDSVLLKYIFKGTRNCKIVFIGDPAQLTPVKSANAPVFSAGFPGVELTQVVRQAEGNPIVDLSTKFRNTVNTGEFFSFKPDGVAIQHMNRQDFLATISAEFTRPDWNYRSSKIMGWTNKCVTGFNQAVNNLVHGTPLLQEGDYAVCNKFITVNRQSVKTDQMVCITSITSLTAQYDVPGWFVGIDNRLNAFLPQSLQEAKTRLKLARDNDEFAIAQEITDEWVDLRPAFASTINKAQGSTFDKVYIDLDDIKRCNSGDQIARMMYVGVSRARHQVILTGDLA